MDGEGNAIVADEQEVMDPPAIAEETIEQPETDEPVAEGEGGEPEPTEEAEELETIEIDGKEYKIPAALKGGFLMQADYTRKTQEVAEQRRELESRAQQIAQQAQATEEEMSARASLVAIDTALEQYAKVNWDQLEAEDPMGAHQHWRRYQTLEKQREQIVGDLHQKQTLRAQAAQQETVKRFEQTQEFAKKNIKGWTPELDKQIIEYAKSKGASDQNLKDIMSPLAYELLYLARIGEQALSKKPAAPQTQTQAKPLSTVGGKSNPSAGKSLGEMSMEEYAAYRQKQMARR